MCNLFYEIYVKNLKLETIERIVKLSEILKLHESSGRSVRFLGAYKNILITFKKVPDASGSFFETC